VIFGRSCKWLCFVSNIRSSPTATTIGELRHACPGACLCTGRACSTKTPLYVAHPHGPNPTSSVRRDHRPRRPAATFAAKSDRGVVEAASLPGIFLTFSRRMAYIWHSHRLDVPPLGTSDFWGTGQSGNVRARANFLWVYSGGFAFMSVFSQGKRYSTELPTSRQQGIRSHTSFTIRHNRANLPHTRGGSPDG
jgi:hypothetical protein